MEEKLSRLELSKTLEMPGKEGHFLTRDKLNLRYRIWDKPEAKSLCVILHGKGEYLSRYSELINYLLGKNISVAGYDQRGHGQSEGKDVHVDNFEDLINDLDSFCELLKQHCSKCSKIILFGHSLGGLVAFLWARKSSLPIGSMILSSPCFGIKLPKALRWVNAWVNKMAPGFVYQNPVYPANLTHDPIEIQKYKEDKLIKRKISARMVSEMLRVCREIGKEKVYRFAFPVYILTAGQERIVDVRKTQDLFEKIDAPHKDLIMFPEMYHEIFHENGRKAVYDALDRILDAI